MPRHPQRDRRQANTVSSSGILVSSFGLHCGVTDLYRYELLDELQSHLCKDTARLVYEYSVCSIACHLRGRDGEQKCCSCRDKRPFNPRTYHVTTRVYVDGKGYVMQVVPRSKWYCPSCRSNPAIGPTADQTEDETATETTGEAVLVAAVGEAGMGAGADVQAAVVAVAVPVTAGEQQ